MKNTINNKLRLSIFLLFAFTVTTFSISPLNEDFPGQWNLPQIDVPSAWRLSRGDESIIIAVIDSGIDLDHEDLSASLWINRNEIPDNNLDDDRNGYIDDIHGWDFSDAPELNGIGDFTDRDNDPSDETGHGTHIAGIIAAQMNKFGTVGIAPKCKVMPLRAGFRVASGGAFLQNDDVAAAIIYAADNGAKIINMSWGDIVNSLAIRDAIKFAHSKGSVLIAGAGNHHEEGAMFPAALSKVISVGAVDRENNLAYISNFGSTVDIVAPGTAIFSTILDNDYGVMSGTSMATPHVSAVAGLLLSLHPDLTNDEVKQILTSTATPIDEENLTGAGIVNAFHALSETFDLTVKITSPENYGGSDSHLEIFGTVMGHELREWQLEYGKSETPDRFIPLGKTRSKPIYNDFLFNWDTKNLSEGKYTVRLSCRSEGGKLVDDEIVVELDHTPPVIESQIYRWYNSDRIETLIEFETDDRTVGVLDINVKNDKKFSLQLPTLEVGTLHILNLSEAKIPSGEYQYRLKLRNRADLLTISANPLDDNDGKFHELTIATDRIFGGAVVERELEIPALHAIAVDLNGDEKPELIGMPLENFGYSELQVFSQNERNKFELKFSTEDRFLPWDSGDLDGDGLMELLVNRGDRTFILEQDKINSFNFESVWEAEGIWGGQFFDNSKIVSRHSATDSIRVYNLINHKNPVQIATLLNPTDGDNQLNTMFAIGDFDGDSRIEIIAGDDDGDLFAYELSDGVDRFEQIWTGKIAVDSILNFAVGDFDGDGVTDFLVSGSSGSKFDLPVQQNFYVAFRSNVDNNYEPIETFRIKTSSANASSMTIAEFDGLQMLVILTPPSLYLIEIDNFEFRPRWHGRADNTSKLLTIDLNDDLKNELLINVDGSMKSLFTDLSLSVEPPIETVDRANLIAVEPFDRSHLILTFDRKVAEINYHSVHYRLRELGTEKIYHPSSVVVHSSDRRLLLTFPSKSMNYSSKYEIVAQNSGSIVFDLPMPTPIVDFSDVTVFPNPATDYVVFDRVPDNSEIELYNVAGERIERFGGVEIINNRRRWHLGGVSGGIYFYRISLNEHVKFGKVAVIR